MSSTGFIDAELLWLCCAPSPVLSPKLSELTLVTELRQEMEVLTPLSAFRINVWLDGRKLLPELRVWVQRSHPCRAEVHSVLAEL